MPVRVSKLNDRPPATIRFYWQDEPVELRYYPHRLTNVWRRELSNQPIRSSLAQVLAGWDVEGDDGAPFQPPAPSDLTHWRAVLAESDATIAEELPNMPEGEDRDALLKRVTEAQQRSEEARIRDAYVAAWERKLDAIGDLDFLIACLNGIADDFLGVRPPAAPSVPGSASTAQTATAPGGTTTSP
jgi:hypothetical protein